jgi:uncharacterized protein YjbJ (UPF0337 family)
MPYPSRSSSPGVEPDAQTFFDRGVSRVFGREPGTKVSGPGFCYSRLVRPGDLQMGSNADKASGLANEAIGKAKQGVGSAVGSDRLKADGAAQEAKGDAQKAVGDAKSKIKDGANKAADAINRNL